MTAKAASSRRMRSTPRISAPSGASKGTTSIAASVAIRGSPPSVREGSLSQPPRVPKAPGPGRPDGQATWAAWVSSSGATVFSSTFASSSMKSTTFSSKIGERRFSAACGFLRKNSITACSCPG
jgi:hypothetical protein